MQQTNRCIKVTYALLMYGWLLARCWCWRRCVVTSSFFDTHELTPFACKSSPSLDCIWLYLTYIYCASLGIFAVTLWCAVDHNYSHSSLYRVQKGLIFFNNRPIHLEKLEAGIHVQESKCVWIFPILVKSGKPYSFKSYNIHFCFSFPAFNFQNFNWLF